MSDDFPQHIIDHHTLIGDFELSSGQRASEYIDLRAAMLCQQCTDRNTFLEHPAYWYMRKMRYQWGSRPTIVATGAFGALLLGAIAGLRNNFGPWANLLLWNPKGHGTEWSGEMPPGFQPTVVLMDDVATTGATLAAMRAACEACGWKVIAEIVAVDRRQS